MDKNGGGREMKKTVLMLAAAVMFSALNTVPVLAEQKAFYVSPDGNDSNDGSIESPFKTIEAARDAVRALKNADGLPTGGIRVILREGGYTLSKGLEFDSRDSGTKDSPIIYSAYENERVRILGGVKLENFRQTQDEQLKNRLAENVRDKLYEISFADYGIDRIGDLEAYGQSMPSLEHSSVYIFKNSEYMNLARYPNEGYLNVVSVIEPGVFKGADDPLNVTPEFKYSYDGAKKWKDLDDIWIFGYLRFDWADLFARVGKINTSSGTIKLAHASPYSVQEDKKFYFTNVFEELDDENEFYIDRNANKLYILSDDPKKDNYEAAILEDNLVSVKNAANIGFENLTFSLCRATAVYIEDSDGIDVKNCEISNNTKNALMCKDSFNCNIENNNVYNLGAYGLYSHSGNVAELIPSNNRIVNNSIHDFAKLEKTYKGGIGIEGCGNYVAHNEIYNALHYGISYGGSYNIIEYNDLHDCLLMAEDAGAVYTGRTWLNSENTFRYNYFHDIPMNEAQTWKNNGIYMDDGMLGTNIYSNVFENIQVAVFSHGGRYAKIKNNLFINCPESVKIIDNYYPSHAEDTLIPQAKSMIEKNPYWAAKFPEVVQSVSDEEAILPKFNEVTGNIMFNSSAPLLSDNAMKTAAVKDNLIISDKSVFEDFDGKNYTIKKGSAIFKKIPDFDAVDFTKVGIIE